MLLLHQRKKMVLDRLGSCSIRDRLVNKAVKHYKKEGLGRFFAIRVLWTTYCFSVTIENGKNKVIKVKLSKIKHPIQAF